jgi:hypothetical protein
MHRLNILVSLCLLNASVWAASHPVLRTVAVLTATRVMVAEETTQPIVVMHQEQPKTPRSKLQQQKPKHFNSKFGRRGNFNHSRRSKRSQSRF